MICEKGKISLYCFLGTAVTFSIIFLPRYLLNFLNQSYSKLFWIILLFFVITNVVIKFMCSENLYKITFQASLLGFIFGLGIFITINSQNSFHIFGLYMCIMAIFHYTEFLSISIIQPKLVSSDSFVLNHGPQYTIAAVISWIEFFLEFYFFPDLKALHWLSYMGVFICICGETLRKSAMFTAKSNFNHLVQCEKADDHVLVTHGVYSFFRHPSYVGWFYWSIGTQIVLLNPFCVIAYALASWIFFKERITIEEITLLNFFGQQYCDYQQRVGTGLPFIQGYRIKP